MTKKMLRKDAVAERYSITQKTVDRWSCDERMGFPPAVMIARSPLWYEHELEEWEKSRARRQGPGTESHEPRA
jgi:predicted DNA-binding transcriptional regulator AlpA